MLKLIVWACDDGKKAVMDEKKRPDRLAHKSCAPCVSAAGASVAGSPGGVWGADAQDGPERALYVCFWAAQFIALACFLWAFFLKKGAVPSACGGWRAACPDRVRAAAGVKSGILFALFGFLWTASDSNFALWADIYALYPVAH